MDIKMARQVLRYNFVGFLIICRSFHDALLIQLFFCLVWSATSLVTLKPVFNKTPLNVTFYIGQTATLPCSVSNLGSSMVVWKRLDQPHPLTVGEFVFVSDPEFSVKHIPFRDEWNLIIDNVQPKHSGRYECQVSSKEDIVRYVDLKIRNEPGHDNKYVSIAGPHYIEKGHPIRLTCNASGEHKPPTDIKWFLRKTQLRNGMSANIRVITNQRSDVNMLYSELRITRSDIDDDGEYICRTSFLNNIFKVAKHKLLVLTADSNQTKRGTMVDGSINQRKDKDQTAHNTGRQNKNEIPIRLPYILTFIVAWCFIQ